MPNITRWNPLGFFGSDEPSTATVSLRHAMDRLFQDAFVQDAFVRPAEWGAWGGDLNAGLALDVYETEDEVVVEAAIPGVRPEDVDITVQGNVLTIRGQTESQDEQRKGSYHLRERRVGSFFRQIQLPVSVNTDSTDSAEARFENGILKLRLPKAEEARERKIQVTSGSGATNGSKTLGKKSARRPTEQPA